MANYWGKMRHIVKANPDLVSVVPGFLIRPEKIVFYMGRTHVGIEYIGPERLEELGESSGVMETQCFDYSLRSDCNLLDEIIGYDYTDGQVKIPLPPISEDFVLPTNAGVDELRTLKWNWSAQEMIVGLNTGGMFAPEGQFTRLVNGRFFDADEHGLKVRYIRWLDLIPCRYDDSGDELDSFSVDLSLFPRLAEVDCRKPFPFPEDFRLDRLQKVNRFVEHIGNRKLLEPAITSFLSVEGYKFILKMRFSAKDVRSELLCSWQDLSGKKDLKPDFFVVNQDGFADIVEFKLPNLSGKVVVGQNNRETFSATINSYISQTRVYREYFDDPRNRQWVKDTYGFDVYRPRRYLLIGRRWDFKTEEWRKIAADFQNLTILTYDDLVDGVVSQFYG